MAKYYWHAGHLLYKGMDLLGIYSLHVEAPCRPDCNEVTGDEDELVAACHDVVRGIEAGDVSKEEVKRAKNEVRQVSTYIQQLHAKLSPWSACLLLHNLLAGLQR